jgi:ferredoxin/coenzyme F420-reducing hydrogenase delta subunit
MTERIKLRIAAQISNAKAAKKYGYTDTDLSFSVPHGEFDRRQFLRAFLPKFDIKPVIDNQKCTDASRCRLCQKSCLFDAIHINEDVLHIDRDLCTECGACSISCPHGAIYHPGYSTEQLNDEIIGLLRNSTKLTPTILALTCHNCFSSDRDTLMKNLRYPVNVLPVEIPCLGMISPVLLLGAFAAGARGIIILYGGKHCCNEIKIDQWSNSIHFIQALLRRWNIEPERVETINMTVSTTSDLESQLVQFNKYIRELLSIDIKVDDEQTVKTKEALLSSLIKAIETKQGLDFKGRISTDNVPFGKLTLDKDKCTGCGLCASRCPSHALTFEPDDYRVLFQHELCSGCGLCAAICPQRCISIEKVLQFEDLMKGPEILFQDENVNCRICGTPFISRSLLREVKSRLNVSGHAANNLEICSDCKLSLHRNPQYNDLSEPNKRNTQEISSGVGTRV